MNNLSNAINGPFIVTHASDQLRRQVIENHRRSGPKTPSRMAPWWPLLSRMACRSV